ncbi:MAG: Dam family site-specific DNA-(adenine-N6)-methyltransferase [Candidatus Sulfotelmatobacter sp.]
MTNVAPFLRWAGSKRQIVSTLASHWNDSFERYVEPFVGSACLFFHLAPRKALLGDINSELIQTYLQVREGPERVSAALDTLKIGRHSYYRIRSLDPSTLTPAQQAARFIYLNRFCFNGLYRTNLSGGFNVPYGGGKSGALSSRASLLSASKLLRRASLKAGDFGNLLATARKGDFVYMDPPFSIRNRRVFREYDPSVFGQGDVLRLRGAMEALADSGIMFVVSYLESEEANFLSRGFNVSAVTVRRNIAGFLRSRKTCRETLIWNTV